MWLNDSPRLMSWMCFMAQCVIKIKGTLKTYIIKAPFVQLLLFGNTDTTWGYRGQDFRFSGCRGVLYVEEINILDEVIRNYLNEVSIIRDQLSYLDVEALRGGCQGHRAELYASKFARSLDALEGRYRVGDDDLKK